MTAPVAVVGYQVREIALDLLDTNPLNPRKTFNDASLAELAQSIRQSGISQPLLVRPAPVTEGLIEARYEIVCGHRRSAASLLAGRETAPCIVREMSDAEAAEIALVDNLQREDVGALEEAEAFGALLARLLTVEAVAARVGKEVSHVARRLKLRALSENGRRALSERLITVDHALLLVRLGADEQDAALKWALDSEAGVKTTVDQVIDARVDLRKKEADEDFQWRVWEPGSPQRLKEHIEHTSGRKLSSAPWGLDDTALLPDVGDCSACPSNTKANAALFSDLAIEEATCVDGGCFEAKREAFVSDVIRGVTAEDGQPPLRLSWKYSEVKPRWRKDVSSPVVDQVFRSGQWIEAKHGSCGHMCSGVTVDWNDSGRLPGELLMVCVDEKCPAHPKAWEQKSKQGAANGKRNEAEEKAAAEKRKAEAIAESKLRIAVASKAIEGITAIPEAALRALALRVVPDWVDDRKPFEGIVPGLLKTLKEAKTDSVEFARALAVASLDGDYLTANASRGATSGRKEFLEQIKRIGYDGANAWKKAKVRKQVSKPAKLPKKKVSGKVNAETRKRIASAVKKRWAKKAKANPAEIDPPAEESGGGDT